METTLEAIEAQFKELEGQKTQLESKLATAQSSMAELQSRYRKAAADVALGAKKPAEQPADVQALIDKQQITVDGFETALSQCMAQWQTVRQELGVLSRERAEQRDREEIQKAIDTAIIAGDAMLKAHDEVQVHLTMVRSIEKQLRNLNKHAEAERIHQTLRTRPNYFGLNVWRALIALEPWTAFTTDNVTREAGNREMRGEKAASA